jgi:hypothetical protein
MEHRFTRQELYDRIWSTPMTRVAVELGTTPNRLSSLVRRAGIPTPPAGYWIKREFGKAETQPPLPPALQIVPILWCWTPMWMRYARGDPKLHRVVPSPRLHRLPNLR